MKERKLKKESDVSGIMIQGGGGGAQWSFHYLRTDPKRLLVVIGF